MKRKPWRPFQHLGPQERRNLALAAVFAFYAAYIGMGLYWNNLFTALGTDYLAFWSAGYLANTEGYARTYDLDALRRVQSPWVPDPADPSLVFTPLPSLFLPVFLPVFQVFALLPADWSLLVWTALSLLLLVFYLRFFAARIAAGHRDGRWSLAMMLSFPVFWSLVWGQLNFLLLVCVGEFLRAVVAGKPFRAGLWLGGLLLKPQTLVLIVPALLLQRSWKTLSGFAIASVVALVGSVGIGGPEAMRRLVDLWLGSASGLPSNNPQYMVNWRMVGINLSSLAGSEVSWGIALAGLALTLLAALSFWLRPLSPVSPKFGVALLGTMAATCASAWHSHLHMMTILIPLLLYLLYQRCLSVALMDLWLFPVPVLMLVGFLLDLMGKFRILPCIPPEGLVVTERMLAFSGWGMCLFLLFWAVRSIRRLDGSGRGGSAAGPEF